MKVTFDRFTLDIPRRLLLRDGHEIPLTPKAFDLLRVLAERRPMAVRKEELLDAIWPGLDVGEASLTMAIAEIRKGLGEARAYVRTVPRFGYAFDVEGAEPEPAAAPPLPPAPRVLITWQTQRCPLGEGDHTIGRDPRCSVWIDVAGVSRQHARLRIRGGTATIEDLGSTNGTFVEAAAVTTGQRLLHGQRIRVGPVELQFRMFSPNVPTEPLGARRRQDHEPRRRGGTENGS